MASGWWIILNDVRVNVHAQDNHSRPAYISGFDIIRCLRSLYDVPSIVPDEDNWEEFI